ncbi:MAG: response regulator transcription factor [Candidatus Kapabacteria bacterium]|nr:response regulator transcription factor [Candidatus Kapabacteria bacterium]
MEEIVDSNYGEEKVLTIVLADDHEIVRAGIKRMLSINKSIKVLDEAANGAACVEIIKYHKPDIALVDILMPIMNGIDATRIIKAECPDTAVIMLTAFEDYLHIEQALNAGANGYLSKDISAKDLIEAIFHVFDGERVFSKSILKLLKKKFPESVVDATPVVVSKREQEILNLVALGKTSGDIANELFISVRTVESHRYNLMQKLNVKNAAGLARYAMINQTMYKRDPE